MIYDQTSSGAGGSEPVVDDSRVGERCGNKMLFEGDTGGTREGKKRRKHPPHVHWFVGSPLAQHNSCSLCPWGPKTHYKKAIFKYSRIRRDNYSVISHTLTALLKTKQVKIQPELDAGPNIGKKSN